MYILTDVVFTKWPFVAAAVGVPMVVRMLTEEPAAVGVPMVVRMLTEEPAAATAVSKHQLQPVNAANQPWHSRFAWPAWWGHFALPMYLLHQFEEYGFDLMGRHFAFHRTLCANMGFTDTRDCPIRPWHLTYINVVLVTWASYCARDPLRYHSIGSNFWGLCIVNAFVHVQNGFLAAARNEQFYNAGLLTAITLLLPAGCAALTTMVRQGHITRLDVARNIVGGIVYHVILLVGMRLRAKGTIGDVAFVLWETVDIYAMMCYFVTPRSAR